MPQTSRNALQPHDRPHRWVSGVLGLGAALATILASAHSCGLIGDQGTRLSVANFAVSWVGLAPASDTARALGDTLRYVATVTDRRGTALVGAAIEWKTDDPTVATVDSAGFVVARRPGTTILVATVAEKTARARVVVRPKAVRFVFDGDSALHVPEGGSGSVHARALDARGHLVPGVTPMLRAGDSTVASITQDGRVRGHIAGRTALLAELDGIRDSVVADVIPVPGRLVVVKGADQHAGAEGRIPEAVVVRVDSRMGRPLGGVMVRFLPADGAGSTRPDSVATNQDGLATAVWTAGDHPGRQRLVASVQGVDSIAAVYAEIEPSRANTKVTPVGDAPSGLAGAAQPVTVTVQLADTLGRVLAGVPVTWHALDGGSISAKDARSDSAGEARAEWWLGPKAGVQRAQVLVGNGRNVPAATVIAAAFPGEPAKLALVGSGSLEGTVGVALSRPVAVRVTDAVGNAVPGIAVSAKGPGAPKELVAATDSTGRASIAWTLGEQAGAQTLVVSVDGVAPLRIAAQVHSKPAANLEFVSAPSAGHAGRPLGKALRVRATDVYGNPVPDAQVELKATEGSVRPSKVSTGKDGTASTVWTLGKKSTRQTLTVALKHGGASDSLEVDVAGASGTGKPAAAAKSAAATKSAATKPAAAKPVATAKLSTTRKK
ncbi:MAG TPA: Ig-like domain-containing protein [Gemmatimonadales bacterium]|nr:Ig-like domain-containing protein [Gemmatimonadales bacterium]